MSAIMEKIEQVDGQGKPEHQRAMLALYSLYNMCLRSDLRRPDWERFLEKHQAVVDQPAVELMATRVVLDGGFPWTYAEGAATLASHENARFHRGVFHLPLAVEVALTVAVANQALREGLPDAYASTVKTVLLNSSGRPPLQAVLQKALEAPQEIEIAQVLPRKASPIDDVGL